MQLRLEAKHKCDRLYKLNIWLYNIKNKLTHTYKYTIIFNSFIIFTTTLRGVKKRLPLTLNYICVYLPRRKYSRNSTYVLPYITTWLATGKAAAVVVVVTVPICH